MKMSSQFWGGDLAWLIACTGIRVYCVWSTTKSPLDRFLNKPDVVDFMKHPILGFFDAGWAALKGIGQLMVIYFEFSKDFFGLSLLRANLRLLDHFLEVGGAMAYLIAGVTIKNEKRLATMAAGAMVGLRLAKLPVMFGDKWAEEEIKKSKPPKKQG
jgi:hypothetical protein